MQTPNLYSPELRKLVNRLMQLTRDEYPERKQTDAWRGTLLFCWCDKEEELKKRISELEKKYQK